MFESKLVRWQQRRVANDRDFDGASGEMKKSSSSGDETIVLNETLATDALKWLADAQTTFEVAERSTRTTTRSAPPPFITSTLQQVAARKLGFSPSYTMGLAQELYESGLITYMRTDSPTLSTEAQQAMTTMITQQYGAEYLLSASNAKKGKAPPKNAQEAHEAIRPALVDGRFRDPATVRVESAHGRALYELIYRRTLASAMRPSKTESVTVAIKASKAVASSGTREEEEEAMLQASMSTVVDPGYLLCADAATYRSFVAASSGGPLAGLKKGSRLSLAPDYFTTTNTSSSMAATSVVMTDDDPSNDDDRDSSETMAGSDGDSDPVASASTMALNTIHGALKCTEHATRPPSRFTEASFIKELESRGVGRPSTYSAILAVLKERGYILVDRQTIVPTGIGLIVARYLRRFFPDIVDDSFTANMEATLDQIATGTQDKLSFLKRYFLADDVGLFQKLRHVIDEAAHDRQGIRSLEIPALRHLGELAVANGALFFHYHRNPVAANNATTTTTTPSTAGSSTSAPLAVRRRLTPALEQDLRLWTVEAFEALKGDLSAISTAEGADLGVGISKHDNRPYRFILKNGPYGVFLQLELQEELDRDTEDESGETPTTPRGKKAASLFHSVNKSVPSWVNESLVLSDAIDFAALPTILGVFPDTQTNMTLSLRQGQLIIAAENYDYEVVVPSHIYVRDVTVEEAIDALRASQTPRVQSSVRILGHWRDEPIVIGVGQYGPYARWKTFFVNLRRYKDALDTVNVSAVIVQLQKKVGKGKKGAVSSGEKTTAKAATTKTTTKSTASEGATAATKVAASKSKAKSQTTTKAKATQTTKSTTKKKKAATTATKATATAVKSKKTKAAVVAANKGE